MYVQVQRPDKGAVVCSLPAFARAGSCTVVHCIALHLKGNPENLERQCSPI